MTLFELSKGQVGTIIIEKVEALSEDLFIRLNHLGFVSGETIKLCSVSPVFKGSVLVDIRGAKIALSEDEAKIINVKRA